MFDHLVIEVSDFDRSEGFYTAALQPLGINALESFSGEMVGFGTDSPLLWIASRGREASSIHLAFTAPSREAVDRFHSAAVGAGGTDNGSPGVRPDYGPDYYAAFVYDPDGNNIEAVCNGPTS